MGVVAAESWKPSFMLRVMMVVGGLINAGVCYVIVRFLFPQVFLLPVTIIAAAVGLGLSVTPYRVILDRAEGKVAVRKGPWTRHARLTEVIVDEDGLSRIVVKIRGAVELRVLPFRGRCRWLRLRSGFEGMDLALAAAVAAIGGSRNPAPEHRESRHPVLYGALLIAGGVLGVVLASLVQPQVNGWFVHAAAWVLRFWFGAPGAVLMLIGAWTLYSGWHSYRMSGSVSDI
jgi:hypothetical protein